MSSSRYRRGDAVQHRDTSARGTVVTDTDTIGLTVVGWSDGATSTIPAVDLMPAGTVAHWTISHGMSGYLPMSDDIVAWLSWSDARAALVADMIDYADTNDDMAYELLQTVPASDYPTLPDGSPDYGDDMPTMRATVDSMVADGDVAPFEGQEWTCHVDDSDGRTIYFALSRHESSECDDMCDVVDED